jgi:hypothetical protein
MIISSLLFELWFGDEEKCRFLIGNLPIFYLLAGDTTKSPADRKVGGRVRGGLGSRRRGGGSGGVL